MNKLAGFMKIFIVFCFIVLLLGSCQQSKYQQQAYEQGKNINTQSVPAKPKDKHTITKNTFGGRWAFTVNEIKIYNVPIEPDSVLTGTKVIIDGKAYALTENLTNLPPLPKTYWAAGKKEGDVCMEVMLNNSCKASLADTINYADKLEIEKK